MNERDDSLTLKASMLIGSIWSLVSVGWIAAILLLQQFFSSGLKDALFWFSIVMLSGAVLFIAILALAVICEMLNLTTKYSLSFTLKTVSWGLVYNTVIGILSLYCSTQI